MIDFRRFKPKVNNGVYHQKECKLLTPFLKSAPGKPLKKSSIFLLHISPYFSSRQCEYPSTNVSCTSQCAAKKYKTNTVRASMAVAEITHKTILTPRGLDLCQIEQNVWRAMQSLTGMSMNANVHKPTRSTKPAAPKDSIGPMWTGSRTQLGKPLMWTRLNEPKINIKKYKPGQRMELTLDTER